MTKKSQNSEDADKALPVKSVESVKTQPSKKGKLYGPITSIVLLLFIFFGGQYGGALVAGILIAIFGGSSQIDVSSASVIFLANALSYSLMFYLLYWFLQRRGLSLKELGLKAPRLSDAGWAVLGFVGYVFLYMLITTVAKAVFKGLDLDQEQQLDFSRQQDGIGLMLAFVGLVIFPPVMEEILARGLLYGGLRTKLKFVPAMLITSLVFGAAHLQWSTGAPLLWSAMLDTFALSMVLVALREKTGSLSAPIFLHGLKNFVAFLALFVFSVT